MSIQERAKEWYLEGRKDSRVGSSSVFLCHTLTGIPTPDYPIYGYSIYDTVGKIDQACPSDGDDLWRCIRFIRKIPELKLMLGIMILYPGWEKIIENWDLFDAAFDPTATNGNHLQTLFNSCTILN
jgi:hypothetical protein